MSKLNNDPIKKMVAQSVQHHMITDPAKRPGLLPQPKDVIDVEAYAVDELNTAVRIKTQHHGIRYFNIKVSEVM